MQRSILVPVDNSVHTLHSLSYISRLFSGCDEVNFRLLSVVFCASAPACADWMDEQEVLNMLAPDVRRRLNSAKSSVKEIKNKLVALGVGEDRISADIKMSTRGVAAEIIQEARSGMHDSVLIGRRGIGKVGEMIMGSVSATILDKCHDVPVWVVDGKVDSKKFLLPVDETVYSLKAVDHLAFILKDNFDSQITLFHSGAMFSRGYKCDPEEYYDEFGEEWSKKHACHLDHYFHAPEQILIENGFPAEKIFRLETTAGFDPANRIIRQTLLNDIGTIVMGRRGGNVNKGIFKGVSDRVLAMAEEVSVWIVG